MQQLKTLRHSFYGKENKYTQKTISQRLHIDLPLLSGLALLTAYGLLVLYSAGNESYALLIKQVLRLSLASIIMLIFAQVPPFKWRLWSPWLYAIGTSLLLAVLIIGVVGKGAQRWLNLGFIRFQPSEIMKLAIPMCLAWYLNDNNLPPKPRVLTIAAAILIFPVLLTAKQPDLGTALMLACSGACVLLLAGISWRLIASLFAVAIAGLPIIWHFMHDYQRHRVMTFLNPENDPLGHGYHIIQSKIAIGSGGLLGKGWLGGTQSHLDFLPEHATDFIFAVCGEEFGLIGAIVLLAIYLFIVMRCMYISMRAQDTYGRLLAGSLGLTFFFSIFVNIGMVTGLLPVVGVPLPLFSYGGTSMVTLMASFGLIMSIHTHRKFIPR